MTINECLIYITFLLISTTGLLPWNLFMNAHEYFHYKLRNVTNDIGNMTIITDLTELQRSYEGWLTITSGISCLFGSLFNFLTTERFHLKILSLNNRIYFSINH
uniref:Uncharacterized protein n=1 Tax=Ascaris lumbricoides TaxID=6252 RepID=A0A0M3HG92_ASCLU